MPRRDTVVEERKLLDRWLLEDFGADSADLHALCCEAETGRPLYLSHVTLVLECFPNLTLDPPEIDRLRRAYVYLISVYYLVDAVTDGHPCHGSSLASDELVSVIPILEAAALGHFAALGSERGLPVEAVCNKLISCLNQNRKALQVEKIRQTHAFSEWIDEFFHLWARSNCFMFLFDFAAALQGVTLSPRLLGAVHRLLAAIQRGDDSSDWREDFTKKSYTPFIRLCFSKSNVTIDQSALEEIVYLQSALEEELQALVYEFGALEVLLGEFQETRPVANLAKRQHLLVRGKLEGLREAWEGSRAIS